MAQLSITVIVETSRASVGYFSKLPLRRAQFTAKIYIPFPVKQSLLNFCSLISNSGQKNMNRNK